MFILLVQRIGKYKNGGEARARLGGGEQGIASRGRRRNPRGGGI